MTFNNFNNQTPKQIHHRTAPGVSGKAGMPDTKMEFYMIGGFPLMTFKIMATSEPDEKRVT